MALGADQLLPCNVADTPESVIVRQNDVEGHDTEIIPRGPAPGPFDHRCPSKVRACPSRSMATQNFGVAQDTSNRRSLGSPLLESCMAVHECPWNVPMVLAAPAVPFAPTVAQKVTVGHDTLYVPAVPTDIGGDHEWPSYVTELPPADMATQCEVDEQDTDVRVPPAPTGWGVDHLPLRQKSAEPFSSTPTHAVTVGHDTP